MDLAHLAPRTKPAQPTNDPNKDSVPMPRKAEVLLKAKAYHGVTEDTSWYYTPEHAAKISGSVQTVKPKGRSY